MCIEMMWLKSLLKSLVLIELLLHVQLESLPMNIIFGTKWWSKNTVISKIYYVLLVSSDNIKYVDFLIHHQQ